MSLPEAKQAAARAETMHTESMRVLDAAKARHAAALEHVDVTARETAEAHARLADDPSAAKKARDARASHDGAVAVAEILLEGVSRASLGVEVAAATLANARKTLHAAERDADIDAAAVLMTEAADLEAKARAIYTRVDAVIEELCGPLDSSVAKQNAAELLNVIKGRAGLEVRDWRGDVVNAAKAA